MDVKGGEAEGKETAENFFFSLIKISMYAVHPNCPNKYKDKNRYLINVLKARFYTTLSNHQIRNEEMKKL